MKTRYDVVVIGGGPSGLASAIEAKKAGAIDVLIIERNEELGGILMQCIHNGFGSVLFHKDFPGPTYAQRFIDELIKWDIEVLTDTMVMDLTHGKRIYANSSRLGYLELTAKAVVLAMGCRERTRAQIRIPGCRPAGVFTAGTVQRLVNIEGYMPGKRFVILGSGDIGMIMARRLTMEGAKVLRVLEILPYLTGLRRNYVQCLEEYGIPLYLGTTVKRVIGEKRVEAIETVRVNERMEWITDSEETIECDTLLLSVGLIPENELSRRAGVELDPMTGGPIVDESMQTSVEGIFAAGNVVTIYDLVDYVSLAAMTAGKNAALYAIKGQNADNQNVITLSGDENIRSLIPQRIRYESLADSEFRLSFRVARVFERKILIELVSENRVIQSFKENYARPAEMLSFKIKGNLLREAVTPLTKRLDVRLVDLG